MTKFTDWQPHGVIPAVLLPFHRDFSIDETSCRKHLRDVAAVDGISAITVNGHSSEVHACNLDEQQRVLALTMDELGDRLPIIAGVYSDGSLEAARIARMAEAGGASCLLVFPPQSMTMGGQLRPEMAVAHFRDDRGGDEPALDLLQLSAGGWARLSARDLAAPRRGGALDPRGQGLVGRPDGARAQHPRAAIALPPGQCADDAQRVAPELAGAGLQRAPLRRRQRHRRPSGRIVPRGPGATTSPRRGRSTSGSIRWPRPFMHRLFSTCTTG